MKEFIKHNPATLDNVETMANAMIESMRFVDNTLDYPEAEKARPNDGVEPEWTMTPTTAPFPPRN